MMRVVSQRVVRWEMVALGLVLAGGVWACAPRRPVPRGGVEGRGGAAGGPSALDVTRLYRQAGLIAESAPVSYVGSVYYLASDRPDSTLVLLTLSLANRTLTFVRDQDRYRAVYEVTGDVRQDGAVVRRLQGREVIRVAAYKETSRADESVIFRQYFRLAPGRYALPLVVRDVESGRGATHEVRLDVPRLGENSLSSAVPVYASEPRARRDSLPDLVPNPRSTAIFGRDSAFTIYVESYGAGAPTRIRTAVRDLKGELLWSDTLLLTRRGALSSGRVALPTYRLLPGVATLLAWREGSTDTVRTPLVVSFGEGLAVTSFEDMLHYLRYFGSPERISRLRGARPEERAATWVTFLRETDPDPATPEHEGLRNYFIRIEQANARFRDEGGPGWLTERGMVYVSLGEPDQILEQGVSDNIGGRGRTQIWQYTRYRAQLVFVDQSGFGRWRLTSSSESEFQSIVRRERSSSE